MFEQIAKKIVLLLSNSLKISPLSNKRKLSQHECMWTLVRLGRRGGGPDWRGGRPDCRVGKCYNRGRGRRCWLLPVPLLADGGPQGAAGAEPAAVRAVGGGALAQVAAAALERAARAGAAGSSGPIVSRYWDIGVAGLAGPRIIVYS